MNNPVNKPNDFALIAKEEQSNPYVPFGYKTETSIVNA